MFGNAVPKIIFYEILSVSYIFEICSIASCIDIIIEIGHNYNVLIMEIDLMNNNSACACKRVEHVTLKNKDGTNSDAWRCVLCSREFIYLVSDILEYIKLIDEIRSGEASSITIVSDNADFDGPNNIVIYEGPKLGGWDSQTFEGDSVLECLRKCSKAL